MGTGILGTNMKNALDTFVAGMGDSANWTDTDRLNAKKAEGNAIEDWFNVGSLVELDQDNLALSSSHWGATILVTAGSSNRTIDATTITGSSYKGFRVRILKVDAGAGYVLFSPKSGEYAYNGKYAFSRIDIWYKGYCLDMLYDGTQWYKVNAPTEMSLPYHSGYFYSNTSPGSNSWHGVDFSSYCPSGTIALDCMTYQSYSATSYSLGNSDVNTDSYTPIHWVQGYDYRTMARTHVILNASGVSYFAVNNAGADIYIGYPFGAYV